MPTRIEATPRVVPDADPSERGGSVKGLKWALRESKKEEQELREERKEQVEESKQVAEIDA